MIPAWALEILVRCGYGKLGCIGVVETLSVRVVTGCLPMMEEDPDSEGDDNVAYVTCPICKGGGADCRYCEGNGDVHPDDVEEILRAAKEERAGRTRAVAAVILCLVLGGGVATFLIVRGGGTQEQEAKPLETLTPAEAIEEMKKQMALGTHDAYKRVIRIGEKVLPRVKALEEQKVMLRLVDDAKEKLSLGR